MKKIALVLAGAALVALLAVPFSGRDPDRSRFGYGADL